MNELIAPCGIICTQCPAFIATVEDDDIKREETAKKWSKECSAEIKKEDINCDGCLSNSNNLFIHCRVCEIRKCILEKGISSCAMCAQFACEKLNKFLQYIPDVKKD